MFKKIIDAIITILLIANLSMGIWYCFDPYFMDKLEDDTRIIIAFSMISSWAIIGGLEKTRL